MDQHIDTPHLYPATLSPEPEGGFTVTFRDLPEAITYGVDEGEARTMAVDVLELAIAELMARGEDIPTVSAKSAGDVLVPIRPLLAAKAALHAVLARNRVSKSDLARRLGSTKPWCVACCTLSAPRGSTTSRWHSVRWA